MLRWHNELYVGKTVHDAEKIRRKLDEGKCVPFTWLITLSENPQHLLEICPAVTLMQKPLREMCPEIIGIVNGKEEAMQMVSEIVQEVYEKTGNFHVKEYLKNR